MKKQSTYVYTLSLVLLFACAHKLDLAPESILQDAAVFSDESAIMAYMASLYDDLPIEDFNYAPRKGFNSFGALAMCHLSDEAISCQTDNPNSIGDGTWLSWWGYGPVRNVNYFISQVPTAAFSLQQKQQWLGEARCIRAWYYFAMVKRYGGVPLITAVQSYTGSNVTALQVPRNTEKEVYDFIAAELDTAAQLLPATSEKGRINKYVAWALQSRAMLYAAAIARYGTVALNGLTGIPSANANAYWQMAYDAAQKVIVAAPYTLYDKYPDKTQNFINLFLDVTNPEAILVKQFRYPQKTHSYDLWALPWSARSADGYGSRIDPTLELCEAYEYTDGTAGKLLLADPQGHPIAYTAPTAVFQNKDPRFAATIIYPFASWKGSIIDVQAGIIDQGQVITAGDYNNLYKGRHIIGANGIGGGGGEVSQTGFYVRKYLDTTYDRSAVHDGSSDQAYIVLRYAEVLLNYAEAAAELGKTADAMQALNAIRNRAGIRQLEQNEVTIDRVRHERLVELAFESHRYWDLRRWRIADQVLNNRKMSMLQPFLVLDSNAYIFKTAPVAFPKYFLPRLYYERIDPAEIAKNPGLVQNVGY